MDEVMLLSVSTPSGQWKPDQEFAVAVHPVLCENLPALRSVVATILAVAFEKGLDPSEVAGLVEAHGTQVTPVPGRPNQEDN